MYLVEEFYSFQGEGKFLGTPSIFIRFGGCNLKCIGFGSSLTSNFDNSKVLGCDSLQAVDKKHFGNLWKEIKSSKELIQIVDEYQINLPFKADIVLTGGEPLIYYKNEIFYEFISTIQKLGHRVTIETNATIEIDFEIYPEYKDVTFAMSVKLSNSNEPWEKRVNQKAIKAIVSNTKDSFFKFVLNKDYIREFKNSEIEKITNDFNNLIYCMPMGESLKILSQNDKDVIEFCKEYGYIYSDRLHIRIYNKRRGV